MGVLFWAEQWGRWPARPDDVELVDRPVRVIGIDLGTTNSVVTDIVWDPSSGSEPSISTLDIPQRLHDGNEVLSERVPSAVALHEGVELVGEGAKRLQAALSRHGLVRDRDIWWEVKNWIGTRRNHRGAPDGYSTPADISARILRFLLEAARDRSDVEIDHVVVTIPASFQLTQRNDTIEAAKAAGLTLDGGNMLDEPLAAFIDYASLIDVEELSDRAETRLMVVDFGGGTCDVALLTIGRTDDGLSAARRNVSRFHRIGGGDIDMAIADRVLLPRMLKERKLDAFTYDYRTKRDFILPALAAVAEKLKIKLADEMQRLDIPEDGELEVSLPVVYDVPTPAGLPTLSLKPTLSLAELRTATEGFLSRVVTPPAGFEYYSVTSVFAPIDDAMRRAQWTAEHLDAILLVGGSSMYRGFQDAIRRAFPDARLLAYRDGLAVQRAISRGAAIHAFYQTAFGRPPIQPTLGEGLSILTDKGLDVIVPAGTNLPHPSEGGPEVFEGLSIPESLASGALPLTLQFNSGGQPIYSRTVPVMAPISKGDPIELSVAIDADQVFALQLDVRSPGNEQSIEVTLANPLAITQNPNEDRDRILELTEKVERKEGDGRKHVREMADLHQRLGEYERARYLLDGLLASASSPAETRSLLFELARLCERMGDKAGEIAYYRSRLQHGKNGPAAFNLALALHNADQNAEALQYAEMALELDDGPADHVLLGEVLEELDRGKEAAAHFVAAVDESRDDLESCEQFELSWLRIAGRRLNDKEFIRAVDAELKSRRERPVESVDRSDRGVGFLPQKDD